MHKKCLILISYLGIGFAIAYKKLALLTCGKAIFYIWNKLEWKKSILTILIEILII